MSTRYPPGNTILCRFFFSTVDLTEAQEERFFNGEGLPTGVGYDPSSVLFVYEIPFDSTPITLEGASVVKDEKGGYHALLTPEDGQPGTWRYKGRGLNAGKEPIATTNDRLFVVS
jgi:hypothetical protein